MLLILFNRWRDFFKDKIPLVIPHKLVGEIFKVFN